MVLAVDGEGPVVLSARLGADALGHLLLDHHSDDGEAARLNKGGDDGGGDVVGQIAAGGELRIWRQMLLHQLGNIHL